MPAQSQALSVGEGTCTPFPMGLCQGDSRELRQGPLLGAEQTGSYSRPEEHEPAGAQPRGRNEIYNTSLLPAGWLTGSWGAHLPLPRTCGCPLSPWAVPQVPGQAPEGALTTNASSWLQIFLPLSNLEGM